VALGQEVLFDRYVTAFERHDISGLVALLHQEVAGPAGHASAA
jgi:hypothetical protein